MNKFLFDYSSFYFEIIFYFFLYIDLSDLIHHLLEQDPLKRCTLSEVEQHPWVTQPVNIEDYKFSEVISVSKY